MKLLVFTTFYPPHAFGGYELRCRDVVDGLRAREHKVEVITGHCPARSCELHSGEKGVHRVLHQKYEASNVFGQILHDTKDLQFIDRLVREFNPDIIYLWHIQDLSNAILPYFSHRDIKIVYDEGGAGLIFLFKIWNRGIYFFRNKNDPLLKKWLKNVVYHFARIVSGGLIHPSWHWPTTMRVYFNSHSALENSSNQGVPVDGAEVLHSGLEITNFPYRARQSLGSPLTILVPGRIKFEKGTKDAVALLGELSKQKIPAKLKVVGKIQSQEYFSEILDNVRTSGLDDVFEYIPMVSQNELARMYRQSDICFFPTYFQSGFSRVPLEAMASGCLVITYGNEGSREIVQNEETGFLIPEGDINTAVNCIKKMLDNSDAYEQILQNARRQVESNFTTGKYINFVESALLKVHLEHSNQ